MKLEERQTKVNDYILVYDSTPLQFYNLDPIDFKNYIENKTLEELTLNCLDLTNRYSSINLKGRVETSPERRRSSLDIYRHVIYFNPEITVFDIMSILYKNKKLLFGNYCYQVHRRVFKLMKNVHHYAYWDEPSRLSNLRKHDEYGLIFSDWKNINGKEN